MGSPSFRLRVLGLHGLGSPSYLNQNSIFNTPPPRRVLFIYPLGINTWPIWRGGLQRGTPDIWHRVLHTSILSRLLVERHGSSKIRTPGDGPYSTIFIAVLEILEGNGRRMKLERSPKVQRSPNSATPTLSPQKLNRTPKAVNKPKSVMLPTTRPPTAPNPMRNAKP